MTEQKFVPMTTLTLEHLRKHVTDESHIAAAEGADLMRDLMADGSEAAFEMCRMVARLCSLDAKMAELTIASLLASCVKGDRLIKAGIEAFESAPEAEKERVRATQS